MKILTSDEFIKRYFAFQKANPERIVTCANCSGKGTDECCECGNERSCDICEGSGKAKIKDLSDSQLKNMAADAYPSELTKDVIAFYEWTKKSQECLNACEDGGIILYSNFPRREFPQRENLPNWKYA